MSENIPRASPGRVGESAFSSYDNASQLVERLPQRFPGNPVLLCYPGSKTPAGRWGEDSGYKGTEKELAERLVLMKMGLGFPKSDHHDKARSIVDGHRESGEKVAPNLAVIVGNGLADVDIDDPTALELARYFLPKTPIKHGRESARASHWWYRVKDGQEGSLHLKGLDGKTTVELRNSRRSYTVVSGIHESGEHIRFEDAELGGGIDPSEQSLDALKAAVCALQLATVLAKSWPRGDGSGRHEACVELAGALMSNAPETHLDLGSELVGWTKKIIRAVSEVTGDEEAHSRVPESVESTRRKAVQGGHVTGLPSLVCHHLRGDREELERVLRQARSGLDAALGVRRNSSDAAETGHGVLDVVIPEDESDDAGGSAPPSMEEGERSPWAPRDLTSFLDGTHKTVEPTLMPREDGSCLLYPGMTHSIHGEPESGKSMLAQAEAARVLAEGGTVTYLDFEADAGVTVERLLALGAPAESIRDRLTYVDPDRKPGQDDQEAWRGLLSTKTDLAVIDGVTAVLSLFGLSSMDNDDVTKWSKQLPEQLAKRTGAAVVLIDHVTKTSEGRGRYAIGAQAKMATITGAAFTVEVMSPLGRGMTGELAVKVGKDRHGQVRPLGSGAEFSGSTRLQEVARAVFESSADDRINYFLNEPVKLSVNQGDRSLLTGISQLIEKSGGAGMSQRKIRTDIGGKNVYIDQAIEELRREGYIVRKDGKQKTPFVSVTPYRATEGRGALRDGEPTALTGE